MKSVTCGCDAKDDVLVDPLRKEMHCGACLHPGTPFPGLDSAELRESLPKDEEGQLGILEVAAWMDGIPDGLQPSCPECGGWHVLIEVRSGDAYCPTCDVWTPKSEWTEESAMRALIEWVAARPKLGAIE